MNDKLPKPKYVVNYVDENGHYYIIDGKKYGSVTAVLNIIGGQKTAALQGWSKKVALNYVSDELKNNIGKDVVIYPHALRGSRGNSLYKTKGINIETIQALLHHSDSGTTMKSYIEHNDEDTNNLIFGDYKTQEEE